MRRLAVFTVYVLSGCVSTMHARTPPPSEGRMRILYESCASARGLLITHVEPGFAADRAGIVQGDVLASVDGAPVSYHEPLERALAGRRPGDTVRVAFARQGVMHEQMVTLDGPTDVAVTASGYRVGGCDWGL